MGDYRPTNAIAADADVEPSGRESQLSVLVVWGTANRGKIERHVGPLADVAETSLVCLDDDDQVEDIRYLPVPTFGIHLLGLMLFAVRAVAEAVRGDYDAIVSFSLFPHGVAALVAGAVSGTPSHFGVLGIDLDHHARTRYGPAVAWLFRRFDAVSVPGSAHREQLHKLGVSPSRTTVLANAIDAERFRPDPTVEGHYDAIWVGRVDKEKNPLAFVDAVARVRDEGHDLRVAMVGDGPLMSAVEARVDAFELEDVLDLEGWADDPLPYYQQADIFVLTSHRDALPLSMVEAMACGAVPVAPRVGNVEDLVVDGQNGLLIDEANAASVATAMRRLLTDESLLSNLASDGSAVREVYSYEAASEDWETILDILVAKNGEPSPLDQSIGA